MTDSSNETKLTLTAIQWPIAVCEKRRRRGVIRTFLVADPVGILTAQGCEDIEPDGEERFLARIPTSWIEAARLHKGYATVFEVGRRCIKIDIEVSIQS